MLVTKFKSFKNQESNIWTKNVPWQCLSSAPRSHETCKLKLIKLEQSRQRGPIFKETNSWVFGYTTEDLFGTKTIHSVVNLFFIYNKITRSLTSGGSISPKVHSHNWLLPLEHIIRLQHDILQKIGYHICVNK